MPATLKDVARKANVSHQTVWRAVHDLPGILPTTRQTILQLANELGYRPNRLAGSLRTKRSYTIGLVIFDVANPYASQLVSGIEAEATAQGFSVLLMSSGDDFDRERRAIASLLERGVDGLILSASSQGNHGYLRNELPPRFPLVAVNHAIDGLPCTTVAASNREAGKEAGAYLAKHGHTAISGLFGDIRNPSVRERHDGFLAALRVAKLPVRRQWVRAGTNSVDYARQTVRDMFRVKQRPTAVFASTHQLTEGALLGLNDIGLHHGTAVAVVGFDVRYAPLLNPPLPVLLQPAAEMGRLAASAVIAEIEGKPRPRPDRLPVRFEHA